MSQAPRIFLAAAAASLALAAPAGATSSVTRLVGKTGPGFTITLKKNGVLVQRLPAGTYRITVKDLSQFHNFHLLGPGVDKTITTVPQTGTVSVRVRLRPGTYTYQCDPHALEGMRGTFRVR